MSDHLANHGTTQLYLDDLAVGQTFVSRDYRVSTDAIKAFAQEFDPQPYHLDEEAAKETFFQGLAASGWHTAAITMRLLTESLPIAGGLIGAGLEELRWLKPVRPNDTIRLETEIIAIRRSNSKPHQGIVKLRQMTYNQAQEPVIRSTSTIVVPSRPLAYP